jgi:hypothetical protein
MRSGLRALRDAGLVRSRFSARFSHSNDRGYVVLFDLIGPAGQMEDHIWIKPENWHGPTPSSGQVVEFTASIQPYRKATGEEDYGLVGLEVLE